MAAQSQDTQKKQAKNNKNKRLYTALLSIYKFSKLEDLFLLKDESFLKLCEVAHIGWDLEENLFKNSILFTKNNTKHTNISPYWVKYSLDYNDIHYGSLTFISSHKISQTKKNFLKKITYFVASSLYFIENKQKIDNSKNYWEMTFNSFYQPLCITDKDFHILKTNGSFLKLIQKTKEEIVGKKVSGVFPFYIEPPSKQDKDLIECSWISHGISKSQKNLSLKFSIKTIVLKNEKIPLKLILVKDITEEFQMEERIAQQAKNKDLGLIKGSIAHELNNPIAGIKALIHIIRKNLPTEDLELKVLFQEMDEAIERCQTIITKLLSVPRQQSKKIENTIDLSL